MADFVNALLMGEGVMSHLIRANRAIAEFRNDAKMSGEGAPSRPESRHLIERHHRHNDPITQDTPVAAKVSAAWRRRHQADPQDCHS
ncbi:hypothetical protein [Tardiphaga sp.]|jgi:hypothetical protein|uniref:hypothetical protein n=1 Tax=Tardiphaga sp. TaxID=1926292 RepID=UPI0037DA67C1